MSRTTGYPVSKKSKLQSEEYRDKLKKAQDLLAVGKAYRDRECETAWRLAENGLEGVTRQDGELVLHNAGKISLASKEVEDQMIFNIIFPNINTIVTGSTAEPPEFSLQPKSKEATRTGAAMLGVVFNRKTRAADTNLAVSLEDMNLDLSLYGSGYIKVINKIVDMPKLHDDGVPTGETFEKVVNRAERVSPWDIWLDPSAELLSDVRWFAHRTTMTRDELVADPNYLVNEETLPGLEESVPVEVNADNREHEAELSATSLLEIITLYEFYDVKNRTMITFAAESKAPLRALVEVDPPFGMTSLHRRPNCPYGKSDVEYLLDLQQEKNFSRNLMAAHNRGNVTKVVTEKGTLDSAAKSALASGKPYQVVEVKDSSVPLDDLVKFVKPGGIDGSAYMNDDVIQRDIDSTLGVTEWQRGESPNIRHAATTVNLMEASAGQKARARLKKLERVITTVGQLLLDGFLELAVLTDYEEVDEYVTGAEAGKIAAIAMEEGASEQFAGKATVAGVETAVPITSRNVPNLTISLDNKLLSGRYEVFVKPNSTELKNPVLREQKYRGMVQFAASLQEPLAQTGTTINLIPLIEQWLDAAGIPDTSEIIQTSQPPALQPQPQQPSDQDPALAQVMQMMMMQQPQGALPGEAPPEEAPPQDVSQTLPEEQPGPIPPV